MELPCSCAYHSGALGAGQRKAFYCTKIVNGRFVYVMIKADDYLTLCQVEVYRGNLGIYRVFSRNHSWRQMMMIDDDDDDDDDGEDDNDDYDDYDYNDDSDGN